MVKRVGILALQGNFYKHRLLLEQIGIESIYVRYASNLNDINGLIIPGGESTTMTKLIDCAGLILMSNSAMDERVNTLKLLDIDVERNASGRQVDSSIETLKINYNNISKNINATFIRAPKIIRYGSHINVLAYYNEIPCAVKSGLHVGLSFHPELNNVSIFHEIAFDTLINKKEDLYAA